MTQTQSNILELSSKTELNNGRYRLVKILGKGGFGIAYQALDKKTNELVAIKEYFPKQSVTRESTNVLYRSPEDKIIFKYGLNKFINEAKIIASFNHLNIVRITDYFEENNTAYYVMPFLEGITLEDFLNKHKNLSQEDIIDIIMPILEGLKEIHNANFLHRDLKPENILLANEINPVLIDFGTAKSNYGEKSQSIYAIISKGYAPVEQYSIENQKNQATDIYAIGAILYKMVTGKTPTESIIRAEAIFRDEEDKLEKISDTYNDRFSRKFLLAIEKALSIKNTKRQKDVQELQMDLSELDDVRDEQIQKIETTIEYKKKNPISFLQLYFSTKGRISRSVYILKYFLPFFIIFLLLSFINLGIENFNNEILFGVFSLILFYPAFCMNVKRLHDRNRGGWFYLLFLIPFVNIWMLIEVLFLKGTDGENRFGEDPLRLDVISPTPNENLTPSIKKIPISLISQDRKFPVITIKEGEEILIGRNNGNSNCDIELNNKYLSKIHIKIIKGDEINIIDQNSANGTFIDGQKLKPYINYILKNNQKLILGSEEVVYKIKS